MTATETELERTEHDQDEAHDAGTSDSATAPESEKTEDQLFDTTDYDREDLQVPRVGELGVDKIRIKLTGSVMLDRSSPADVALFNCLRFGGDAELRVSGTVKASGGTFATNRDGDLDAVVSEKTIAVDSVWVLTPEQLG